jgi:hypothetical protein
MLVRYIDANAVQAGLAARPEEYPYGSARWFARRSGPPWHERRWIEEEVCQSTGLKVYDPAAYSSAFPSKGSAEITDLVERRLSPKAAHNTDLDLFEVAPAEVASWMRRKALLADGSKPGQPVASPRSVIGQVWEFEVARGAWTVCFGKRRRDAWLLLRVGLMRDLTGSTWEEIGRSVGCTASHASRLYRLHLELVRRDDVYLGRTAKLARSAMVRTVRYGARHHLPKNVSHAVIPPLMAIGQPLVIEPQQVQ